MQDFNVTLHSEPSKSFRCQKAANSLDIDSSKKLTHNFSVTADIETPYNVGVIVGASGSGKTTLAKSIWGDARLDGFLQLSDPIIDQFPKNMDYAACVKLLIGVGLTAVPCWIRPAVTLSTGQRQRAEVALSMSVDENPTVIDEWTSVVDRTVAKVMSHSVQRWARKSNRRVVLCTCHYDVLDWLQPDWIIDCNKQEYIEQRGSKKNERKRSNSASGSATDQHGATLAVITI